MMVNHRNSRVIPYTRFEDRFSYWFFFAMGTQNSVQIFVFLVLSLSLEVLTGSNARLGIFPAVKVNGFTFLSPRFIFSRFISVVFRKAGELLGVPRELAITVFEQVFLAIINGKDIIHVRVEQIVKVLRSLKM